MQLWFVLAMSAVFVLAISEIFQKVSLTNKINISAEANNFIIWVVQGTLALLFVLITGVNTNINFNLELVVQMIIIGTIYFAGGTLFYTSYKGNSPSISLILQSFSVIITTSLGILFFAESRSDIKFIGIGIIILAILIANYNPKEKFSKYNLLALGGACLYGIAYTIDKQFSITMNPHIYQILFCYAIAIMTLVFRGNKVVKDLKKVDFGLFKIIFGSAILFFIFNKLNFVAYSIGGEVGKIDAINNSVIFFVIILEILILKDKSSLARKISGSILCFAGILLLGFY